MVATKEDLLDTLTAHKDGCVGMAANMIGVCKRYKSIKVQWQTAEMQTRIKTFTGFPAQIIQHKVDHCNGVLI